MKKNQDMLYADDKSEMISVQSVRPMPDYHLWLRFADGEICSFDMTPLLGIPCCQLFRDPSVFDRVYLDDGIPTWLDGTVDIAPETLYVQGIPC